MREADSRDDLIRTLLRLEAFPWRPASVELVETHMSWVFLAGDRVVKIKRPVSFGFVDHSTIERRRHSCYEEVRLNRRLTDDVYLGTVAISRRGAELVVDGEGELFDWATLMRRLPAERMLDRLLASDSTPDNLIDLLANRLIPFHRDAAKRCSDTADQSALSSINVVTSNLDELHAFAGGPIGTLQFALVDEALRAFIAENAPFFGQRVTDGWVRDGHGDLRAEHICVEEDGTVQIFDCVEFNPSIRCADIASDLAFLLMDLGRLAADKVAFELEERYRAAGIDLPESLLRLYRAHRALVRAKIDCLTMAGGLTPHPGLASEATVYLDLAARAALTVRPFLVAMTGLSGTGKSTVAASIARATGAELISSDAVRKELAGVTGSSAAHWGEGIYSEEWNKRTYEELINRAEARLRVGHPVVLDATFLDLTWRKRSTHVAEAADVPFLLVETVSDEKVVAERLRARATRGDSPSDADLTIYEHQRTSLATQPVAIPSGAIAVRVDTSAEGGGRLDAVYATLQRADVLRPVLPAEEANQ